MFDFFNNISITDILLIVIIIFVYSIGKTCEQCLDRLNAIEEASNKSDGQKAKEEFEAEHPDMY